MTELPVRFPDYKPAADDVDEDNEPLEDLDLD